MSRSLPSSIFVLIVALVAITIPARAQEGIDGLEDFGADSVRLSGRGPGQDSIVVYSARDSIVLSVKEKIMRLYGDAEVARGPMRLTAAYIEIDFNTSELLARAGFDSATGQNFGVPVFKDATQEFSALSMRYNFETGRGITEAVETRVEEGFFFGERIKRVDQRTAFVEDAVYTTCDAPHPHYFFKAEKGKAVFGDRYFLEQPTLNVSDVPIFWIPIGVFFAPRGGKQSGLIIPTWGQDPNRGFMLQGLGYFWAGNEYVDGQITADIFSKGGYTLHGLGRLRVRGSITLADLDYTFGRTRDDPDQELSASHVVSYRHQQSIGRTTQLGGNLNFSTQNALRQTASNEGRLDRLEDVTTRRLVSNFSYSTSWRWGGSFSAEYARHQDVITNEILPQSVTASFRLPTWQPFAGRSTDPGLFDNLAFAYSSTATWRETKQDTLPGGGFRIHTIRRGVAHNPSVNLGLPRIGYFNVLPSVSAQGGWFFRRTVKETVGDTVISRFEPGFYQAWTGSAAVSVTTALYGIVQPRLLGVNALRHTIRPTLRYSWQPDFASPGFGYFDSVYNPASNRVEAYSLFEGDAGAAPIPGSGRQSRLGISIDNVLEAKIAQGDTLEDKKVSLLYTSVSGSYNAAADSLRWDVVGLSARTEVGPIRLNGNATLDPYATDTNGRRINIFTWDQSRTLARITQVGVTASVTLSSQGLGSTIQQPRPSDSVGSRRQRFTFEPIEFDEEEFFGDRVVGAGDYHIPWDLSLSASYSQSRFGTRLTRTAGLIAGLNLHLTPTTRISASTSYDFVNGDIAAPRIQVYKDLHCWEMEFEWTPTGYGEGFYFRVGIKSSQLRDIQYEMRD